MRHQTAKRLAEAEAKAAPPDRCPTCASWKPNGVQLTDDQNGEHWPDRCPSCGNDIATRTVLDYGDLDLAEI